MQPTYEFTNEYKGEDEVRNEARNEVRNEARNICPYCHHEFLSKGHYKKHRERQNGCISWKEMDEKIREGSQEEIMRLQGALTRNISEFNRKERELKEEIIKLQRKALKEEIAKLQKSKEINMLKQSSLKKEKELNEMIDKLKESLKYHIQNGLRYQEEIQYMKDQTVVNMYWKEIHIVCEDIPKSSKNSIKKTLKNVQEKTEIKSILESKGYYVNKLTIDRNNRQLFIELSRYEGYCEICFENKKASVSKCQTCKKVNICEACEMKQLMRFGRCAFCNVDY